MAADNDTFPVVRRITADEGDPHRSWTAQQVNEDGNRVAFPQPDLTPPTKFHPDELPNPDRALEAGLIPFVVPDIMIDAEYRTQPPTESLPVDDPLRAAFRPEEDEDEVHLNTNVLEAYEAAKRQKKGERAAGRASGEADGGGAPTAGAAGELEPAATSDPTA
jgi:hypothetical protein